MEKYELMIWFSTCEGFKRRKGEKGYYEFIKH